VNQNPYQSPAIEEEPEHIRKAKRWTAAPGLGIAICGLCCVAFGLLFVGFEIWVVATIAYHVFVEKETFSSAIKRYLEDVISLPLIALAYLLVGWFGFRTSGHLRNLFQSRRPHRLHSGNDHVSALLGLAAAGNLWADCAQEEGCARRAIGKSTAKLRPHRAYPGR
jgi:hypothetical protein